MDKRKANGDMWSSTPLVSNDLEACQEIAAALSGAKSVDEALAASQAAADAIMSEAGYY